MHTGALVAADDLGSGVRSVGHDGDDATRAAAAAAREDACARSASAPARASALADGHLRRWSASPGAARTTTDRASTTRCCATASRSAHVRAPRFDDHERPAEHGLPLRGARDRRQTATASRSRILVHHDAGGGPSPRRPRPRRPPPPPPAAAADADAGDGRPPVLARRVRSQRRRARAVDRPAGRRPRRLLRLGAQHARRRRARRRPTTATRSTRSTPTTSCRWSGSTRCSARRTRSSSASRSSGTATGRSAQDAGIDSPTLLAYRDRLRRYADFATTPTATFHDLALEMTTQDAAMSLYLTGFLNVKYAPNENYAREFMELFTLGVTDANGNPNYSQTDVHNLARAFTGYQLDFVADPVGRDVRRRRVRHRRQDDLRADGRIRRAGRRSRWCSRSRTTPRSSSPSCGTSSSPRRFPADALASLTSTYLPERHAAAAAAARHPQPPADLRLARRADDDQVAGRLHRRRAARDRRAAARRSRPTRSRTCCSSPTTRRTSPAGRAGSRG